VESEYEGARITLEADRLSRESANRWVAEGNVILTYQETVLRSPYVLYDPITGEAVADQGVEITQGLQWLKGTRAEMNLRTNTGTIHDADGYTDEELYVKAKRLIKTGPDRYTAQDGFLTACQEAVPKWSFTIRQASIEQGGNARFSHTFLKVKKVPVFYLPFMLFPTGEKQRSSGFLIPTMGNSNERGLRISQSFYLVLGRSADLMLHTDYYSKRGFGNGATLRTRPNPVTSLTLDWYWVNDRKDQGGTSFNGIGETKLPHGFRAAAEFNLVTSFLFRQVFSDNFRTATLPTDNSLVFVTNNYQSRSFNVLVSREETVFEGPNVIIRKTPTLDFKLIGQKLSNLPLPFYLDLDTSAAGLNRTRLLPLQPGAPDASPFETPGMTQRLDFSPRLYFSLPLFQGLRVTPEVGFRETFYSNSLRPTVDPAIEDPVSATNIHRGYFQFAMDLAGWGLSKIYRNSSGNEWKHLLEPLVRYRYIAGIDDFDRIIRFDEQDAVANTHEIEYALFNRIFTKRITANGELNHEWLSFKIAQKHFFDSNFGGALRPGTINQFFPLNTLTGFPYAITPRHYSPMTALLRFTPQTGYSFDLRGDYDPKFNTLRNFSVTGFLSRAGLFLGTTYFVTKETPDLADVVEDLLLEPGTFKNNQLQGQVALGNLERGISVSSTLSYDTQAKRLLSHRSRLNYFWDCCGVSVEFEGFNVGVRAEQQFRFSIFFKGIGRFGTINRPNDLF
jgi:LPS-assembly protein